MKLRPRLSYANVIATTALFLALGGGAYAATQLPKNSVGSEQIKKGAVTPNKLSKSALATLTGAQGPRGTEGAKGETGAAGSQGQQGPQGNPGTTDLVQPVIDATGGPLIPDNTVWSEIPLIGTDEWNTQAGQLAVLFAQPIVELGFTNGAGKACLLRVEIRDNGTTIASSFFEASAATGATEGHLERLAYSTQADLGFDGLSTHYGITAWVTPKGPDCMPGTEVKRVRVIAQPVG